MTASVANRYTFWIERDSEKSSAPFLPEEMTVLLPLWDHLYFGQDRNSWQLVGFFSR